MSAVVWWDLDVSLCEQETSAMVRMFTDAVVGWVLDISLSEQQTCDIYILAKCLCFCEMIKQYI
jgi:hypothetical protein